MSVLLSVLTRLRLFVAYQEHLLPGALASLRTDQDRTLNNATPIVQVSRLLTATVVKVHAAEPELPPRTVSLRTPSR